MNKIALVGAMSLTACSGGNPCPVQEFKIATDVTACVHDPGLVRGWTPASVEASVQSLAKCLDVEADSLTTETILTDDRRYYDLGYGAGPAFDISAGFYDYRDDTVWVNLTKPGTVPDFILRHELIHRHLYWTRLVLDHNHSEPEWGRCAR